VTTLKTGARVLAYSRFGAAREKIALPAAQVVPIPDGLDLDHAAGLCVTYGTSYYALKDRAGLKPGETLAVLGASGGVGIAAVEIGKLMGARVIACASSPEKLAFAKKHGADLGIDYSRDDLKEALRKMTDGRGADVVYDPVGGPYSEPALRATAWEGRFLVVGFAAGDIPKIPLNLVLLRSCDIRGVFWGAWLKREPQAQRALMTDIVKWCAEGKLSAHVHAVYPLAETATALKAISDRKVMGKILLRP